MNADQNATRLAELARTLVYANGLGVRAEVTGDQSQRAEAARIHREATAEIERLRSLRPEAALPKAGT